MTWGTLQHQFGSREGLLLAVLEESWPDLQEAVATAVITGDTLEDRLGAVLKVLTEHYGVPAQLAQIQILLDLTQNPTTSDETRQAALAHGRSLAQAWKPLFACALGQAAKEDDLVVFAFKTLRGYLVGELIAARITPSRDRLTNTNYWSKPWLRLYAQRRWRGIYASTRDEGRLPMPMEWLQAVS